VPVILVPVPIIVSETEELEGVACTVKDGSDSLVPETEVR
jgi:hypothetical protein